MKMMLSPSGTGRSENTSPDIQDRLDKLMIGHNFWVLINKSHSSLGLMPSGGVNTKSFHGPLSGPMQPPNSAHVHFPPKKSGNYSMSTCLLIWPSYIFKQVLLVITAVDLDLLDSLVIQETFDDFPHTVEQHGRIYYE